MRPDDMGMEITDRLDANIAVVAKWVTEASRGLLTFEYDATGSTYHSLKLADGRNVADTNGRGEDLDRPITGVGARMSMPKYYRLTQRSKKDMSDVANMVRSAARVLKDYGHDDLYIDLLLAADSFARQRRLAGAR